MEKVKAYQSGTTPATGSPRLSPNSHHRLHENDAPPTNKPTFSVRHNDESNYQVAAHASSSGGGAREQYVMNQEETHHHSNRLHSDDVTDVQPQMTAEDMKRLFKQQQQPAPYYAPEQQLPQQQAADYYTPPSLIQSEEDTDKLLKELDISRKIRPPPPSGSSPVLSRRQPPLSELDSSQELPKNEQDDDDDDENGRPLDPNLVCPKCGKQYRVGEIQKLRRHINQRCNEKCSNDYSDESDEEIDQNQKEIEEMAERHRKEMQGPSTAEVLFDDGDSLLPYDPNLVCPKCGKQYRVGEIQKLRRHINEFCTGMR